MYHDPNSNWKTEYEQRLLQMKKADADRPTDERRQFPRHNFDKKLQVQISGPPLGYHIYDISVGGLAFDCTTNFVSGTRLWLTAGGVVAVEVEVTGVDVEERDSDFMDYGYRIRARFVEEMDGYMAFVLFWDRDTEDD